MFCKCLDGCLALGAEQRHWLGWVPRGKSELVQSPQLFYICKAQTVAAYGHTTYMLGPGWAISNTHVMSRMGKSACWYNHSGAPNCGPLTPDGHGWGCGGGGVQGAWEAGGPQGMWTVDCVGPSFLHLKNFKTRSWSIQKIPPEYTPNFIFPK